MERVRFVAFAIIVLGASLIPAPAVARPSEAPTAAAPVEAATPGSDVRELERTHFTLDGRALPDHNRYRPRPGSRAAGKVTPAIGTVREWLGLDEISGKYYRKNFTLRAIGRHIEVWVAQDIAFPKGDCRKNSVEVGDAQIAQLVGEFDNTIYPQETAAFSTPPDRDGTRASLDGDFTGSGDKTVTLVDNIRDDNYYQFPKAVTYVAGFFSAQLNELLDRNVMTIDPYDWRHRLGPDPADDPTDDLCTSRPARPRLYDATFAHEWQHLLEYYADPNEASWLNEGLSDFAQTLVGYVDGRATVHDRGNDSHLVCFQGFGPVKTKYNANPRECGGPQNSLNLWDEGAPSEVLADYGNAYQFLLYLRDRFGMATISLLHRDGIRQGLAAVQAALPTGTTLYDVLHDYQTMTLVDKVVGEPGWADDRRAGRAGHRGRGAVHDQPREQVRLRYAGGGPERRRLRSTADTTAVGRLRRLEDTAGAADRLDRRRQDALLRKRRESRFARGPAGRRAGEISLPQARDVLRDRGQLRLRLRHRLGRRRTHLHPRRRRPDGGRPARSRPDRRQRPGGLGGLRPQAYAGKKVLLGLRYVSDDAVNKGGWRIGRITLGDKTLSDGSSLAGWTSPTALVPTPVHAWHVTLVGLGDKRARIVPVEKFALLKDYPTVVAIVAYDEPTERVTQYAPYRLTVNGVLQPGGSTP